LAKSGIRRQTCQSRALRLDFLFGEPKLYIPTTVSNATGAIAHISRSFAEPTPTGERILSDAKKLRDFVASEQAFFAAASF